MTCDQLRGEEGSVGVVGGGAWDERLPSTVSHRKTVDGKRFDCSRTDKYEDS